jgi:hypothetical protein
MEDVGVDAYFGPQRRICDQKWGQCEMWKPVFVTMVLGLQNGSFHPFAKVNDVNASRGFTGAS